MELIQFFKKRCLPIFILILSGVLFLSCKDPYENVLLILCVIGFILTYKNIKEINSLKDVLMILIIAIVSYSISLGFLYTRDYKMDLAINSSRAITGEAVILVYEGETQQYSLSTALMNIKLHGGLIDKVKSPFTLYKAKLNYNAIGKSSYKKATIKVKEDLQNKLIENRRVYMGYLYDQTYVEEAIIDAVNDGYHRIIIAPIFLTENEGVNSLKKRVERLKLFNLNIQVKYTELLWNNEVIVDAYLDKIKNLLIYDHLIDTGVILIGEAPKDDKDEKSINSIKQDMMFRKKIQNELISEVNLETNKVRLSWYANKEPSYIDEINNLLQYGVGEIFCIYSKPSVTEVENNHITKKITKQVEIPEGVNIKVIDGFMKNQKLIDELLKQIGFIHMQKWD